MAKKKKKKLKIAKPNIFRTLAFISVFLLIVSFVGIKLINNENFCANSITCIKDLKGIFETNEDIAEFQGKIVYVPPQTQSKTQLIDVLGETTAEKRIEVNLTNQHLYAYEGENLIYDFLVSTGKWGKTPTGTFNIWIKLRYTRMTGGNKDWGTYYNLPNVPYTMYFYNTEIPKTRGYGIHGAYWHNNFGHPMSHGCINMKIEDSEKLYYWANPVSKASTTYADKDSSGTKIIIYGTAPNE